MIDTTYVQWVVEPQPLIQSTNRLNLLIIQIERADVQVGRQTALVIRLRNHRNAALSRPSEQDLRWRLVVLVRDSLDGLVVEEKRSILRLLHVQFQERLWSEGGVRRHSDIAARAQVK